MRYRMIAVDLDGTLLDRHGCISEPNLAAIARARAAGVMVVPCTGRAWIESKTVLDRVPGLDLGVFVGGAVVNRVGTGRSVDVAVIEPNLAMSLVEQMNHLPEAVLVFRDSSLVGHDYLVTGQGSLNANTQWWFQRTGATVHYQQRLDIEDLHHTLRVGLVADGARTRDLSATLAEALGERVFIQSFEAVQRPDGYQSVHVLEVLAAGVDKWRGIEWVADKAGLEPAQIAAVGDQINDLTMIRLAGCGIAMGNAVDDVKQIADHTSRDCDEHGLAYAIDQLLEDRWG